FVGNLLANEQEKELEELFHRYGRIRSIKLKNHGGGRSPSFAFITFQDPQEAENAVSGSNGYKFCSCCLRVEFARSCRRAGGGYGKSRGNNAPPHRRTEYRVLVSELTPSRSWQDLKDHMRKAGDVCYADVHKDGTGIVEFVRKDEMEYALRKLEDTKFCSHKRETSYIRVSV
ncbi:serine/arginine-rich splicing factor 9-like, partial [Dendrobates tinctorius]|uniref:serine/arginine-rich splicing factor 9-like n=1 Tax=Dendrobates tinctorius TaxID=92724 RepID=UPI003CCA0440